MNTKSARWVTRRVRMAQAHLISPSKLEEDPSRRGEGWIKYSGRQSRQPMGGEDVAPFHDWLIPSHQIGKQQNAKNRHPTHLYLFGVKGPVRVCLMEAFLYIYSKSCVTCCWQPGPLLLVGWEVVHLVYQSLAWLEPSIREIKWANIQILMLQHLAPLFTLASDSRSHPLLSWMAPFIRRSRRPARLLRSNPIKTCSNRANRSG